MTVPLQPPYSPHFFLLPKSKSALNGHRFDTTDIKTNSSSKALQNISKQAFQGHEVESPLGKCIRRGQRIIYYDLMKLLYLNHLIYLVEEIPRKI